MRTLFRAAVMAAVLFVLFSVSVFAATEEFIGAILEAAGNPAVLGISLGPIVMILVGIIRQQTGADGPQVKWIALGVAVAAVVLFNVVEGGMALVDGLVSAVIGTLVAIGGHESAGKWLRMLFGGAAKNSSSEPG